MPDDLATTAENTWCPGCGNFAILNAMKKAVRKLEEGGTGRENVAITAGIGCHAKIFDYLRLSGVYALHGRAMAVAQGIKLANPDLKVVAFCGDGDAFGEGLAHTMYVAKRNADITVIVHDNGLYALTTGQRGPTSEKGYKGPSTPRGSTEDPFNPLVLMLEAGATFVARGFSGKMAELADLIVAAVEHEGFSFIQVLQPSVTFNDTFAEYNESVRLIPDTPRTLEEAVALAKSTDGMPAGVLYRADKTPYERGLYGDWNPVANHPRRADRIESVKKILDVG
jgi:2-oxoglutarate ferredoxin oxidoreductase subunit beta